MLLNQIYAFRNAILYSKLKNISEESGMKVYQGLVPNVLRPGELTHVFICPEDQAFWNRCIQLSMLDHPVCGARNLGIGITFTTLYLLQHLVMNQKEPVVYTIRLPIGKDIFYEFVPVVENEEVKDITVKVYRIYAYDKRSIIPSMERESAFYVVDPGAFKGSCHDTDELYDARFIMAASNNNGHWGGK